MSRVEAERVICNELGLHLRAAAEFVKIAARFACDISLAKDGDEVSGKSIIALVTLDAPKGTSVTIVAEGADAEAAVEALAKLIESRFGEDA